MSHSSVESIFVLRCLFSSCAFGWGRRWAAGISVSHWLRNVYSELLKTWSDPLCTYLLPYCSYGCYGNRWLHVPELPLIKNYWAAILSCSVTAKPLLFLPFPIPYLILRCSFIGNEERWNMWPWDLYVTVPFLLYLLGFLVCTEKFSCLLSL